MRKNLIRPSIFFAIVFLLTVFQVQLMLTTVSLEPGSFFSCLWMFAFSFLAVNISILAAQSLFAFLSPAPFFPKASESRISSIRTALLYCVKNESFGLEERIRYSARRNRLSNLHVWILSDSSPAFQNEEAILMNKLRREFGEDTMFYRRRVNPEERKQGNIRDWLNRFGSSYDYFVVCDADSLLPAGWVGELLRIAEHPAHRDIAIFQSAIYITHEVSLYSKMQAVGQYYAQRFYFYVNQSVFGRSISFGHNGLIRRKAFEKIELPRGILSHDNWETALLENQGYRTVFLSDLISFEEATPHYLEDRKRSRRWLKGTFQGWPLLFLPRISFSTRFLIFYQIYLYLVQPVLCFWVISGLWAHSVFGNELFISSQGSFFLLGFTLTVLLGHRMAAAENAKDIQRILQETFFTTLLGLQSILYTTLDFLALPFQDLGWVPMSKNPSHRPSLKECASGLWLGTAAGIVCFWVGFHQAPSWTLLTLPVLASLIFSIPLVYLSARNWQRVMP